VGSDQAEGFWIDCLRRTYPELGVADLVARFIAPVRAMAAQHVQLHDVGSELVVAPIDLPGWLALSAVVLRDRNGVEPADLDELVVELSAQLAEGARRAPRRAQAVQRVPAGPPAASVETVVLPERWEETAGLVGSSQTIRDLVRRAARAARDRYPVLLIGESGVGKEVVARLIHELSESTGPFVAVNCAAIPEALFESELFGHVRGAFSGAHERRDGLFLEAQSGTLLLDEVSEIPLHEQAKILRVLQDGLVRRVGSSELQKVDVRAVATSNRNLEEALADGHLRRDLYYRLAVHEIVVPSLREHCTDIPELVAAFLDRWHRANPKRPLPEFSREALASIVTRSWPGNVRQLEHAIYRLASRQGGERVGAEDVAELARGSYREPEAATPVRPASGRTKLSDIERDTIARALAGTGGNKSAAARQLGITRKTLYRKIRRYGIELS